MSQRVASPCCEQSISNVASCLRGSMKRHVHVRTVIPDVIHPFLPQTSSRTVPMCVTMVNFIRVTCQNTPVSVSVKLRHYPLLLTVCSFSISKFFVKERRKLKPKWRDSANNRRRYNYLCRETKRQTRLDKDRYLRRKCEAFEKAHTQKKSRAFYRATLCVSAVFAVVRCPSVCLSVRHIRVLYPEGRRYR